MNASPTFPASLLDVCGVSKRFGGLLALEQVSFSVAPNEIVGVIGANGAGKSTLFDIITGFHLPTDGEVRFEGNNISGWAPQRVAALGLVKTFQLVRPFVSMTLFENVAVALLRRGYSHVDAETEAREILFRLGLEKHTDLLPSKLPYGLRRRLEIARALAAGPRLLLLDEALAGLTQTELQDLIMMLREIHAAGMTLLMVEHVMDATMALCHRIVVLDKGRCIAIGTPQEISQNPAVIEAYLGREE